MADKKLYTKGTDAVGFNGHLFGYCSEIHHLWQVTSLFLYWPTGNFGWGQINYFHWFAWMTYDNEQSKHLKKEDSNELMCSVSHGLFNHHQRRPYWGLTCTREDATEAFPCVPNISLYNTQIQGGERQCWIGYCGWKGGGRFGCEDASICQGQLWWRLKLSKFKVYERTNWAKLSFKFFWALNKTFPRW